MNDALGRHLERLDDLPTGAEQAGRPHKMKSEAPGGCALRIFRLEDRLFEVYSFADGRAREIYERMPLEGLPT